MGKYKYLLILFILLAFTIATASASDIENDLALENGDSIERDTIQENIPDDKGVVDIQENTLDAKELTQEENSPDIKELSSEIGEGASLKAKISDEDDLMLKSSVDSTASTPKSSKSNLNSTSSKKTVTAKKTPKTTPRISLKTKKIKSKGTLKIYLKNSKGKAVKYKKLKIRINKKNYIARTNSKGMAKLKLSLPAKKYYVKVSFIGDKDYKKVSKKFKIKVSKVSTRFRSYSNQITKNSHLYYFLVDKKGNPIAKKRVIININGHSYKKTTNAKGRIQLKITLNKGTYRLSLKSKENKYYKGTSKSYTFHVRDAIHFTIANKKLLSNGYLRIYLRSNNKTQIKYRKFTITIGKKKFIKKTNNEGNIVFKPEVSPRNYTITVRQGDYYVTKRIRCIEGNVKNPLKNKISLVNGMPDLDLMPGSYVLGDESASYTVTREQYKEVLERDSICLFLNKRLSRYVFFKTKDNPNTNHVIKREKWNVIERELNRKLVSSNKKAYWPSEISASLAGKTYTYSEVRDVQNSGLTCGPASASVCTQALRNYMSERLIAKLAKTDKMGTSCYNMQIALDKNNFSCSYYYKDSFDKALEALQKGGAAVIFHTRNHYVSLIDISKDGKKVLVSNSYGDYDKGYYDIPTNWVTVSHMKTRFVKLDEGLIIRLHYNLTESKKNSINCFYHSMGTRWNRQNTNQRIPNG